ncbi:MAG: fimbrillin family protein [Bacteroides sp.]|nr:fimbrillin family protein [Bacteroides sp.]
MKKIHYLAICLLATGLAACTQNEEISSLENQKAITFDTYVGRDAATRASVINLDALKTSGFGVFGYYTTGDWTTGATPNFMYNQQVSGENWGYAPLKYWPETGKISFFAYAPYGTGTLSDNTETGTPTLTYSVPNTVAGQKDLLVAGAQKNQTGNTVNFTFKHALSRIGFGVKLADGSAVDNQTTIAFSSIALTADFDSSNTLTLDLDGSDNVQWGTPTTATDVTYTLNNTNDATTDNIADITSLKTTTTAINNESSYLMVLPQDFSAAGKEMSITANFSLSTVDTNLDAGEFTADYSFTGDVALNLEAGKAYTIVLVLGKTADTDGDGDIDDDDDSVLVPVKFAVDEVEDWADSTPKDYELPQD